MNIRNSIEEAGNLQQRIINDSVFIERCEKVGNLIGDALVRGNKVLIAGNGGSAADAQHFAAEFVATFKKEKRKGYPVLALTTDTSYLTAWANDFEYKDVFARQVQTWGKKGDIFIGISTSGNSANIVEAVKIADQLGVCSIGLLGGDGGAIARLCDESIIIPSAVTARIQEVHMLILHGWCEMSIPKLS